MYLRILIIASLLFFQSYSFSLQKKNSFRIAGYINERVASSLLELAEFYRNKNIRISYNLSIMALYESNRLNFQCIEDKAKFLVCLNLMQQGLYGDCILEFHELAKSYRKKGELIKEAEIYSYIGSAYLAMSKVDDSLENFIYASKIYEKHKSNRSIYLLQKLGSLYKFQKKYKEAEDCFVEAHSRYMKNPKGFTNYNPYDDLGILYYDLGKKEKGKLVLVKSLIENIKSNKVKNIAKTCNHLGVIFTIENDFHRAEMYIKTSLVLYNRLLDFYGIAKSINNLAYIHENMNTLKASYNLNRIALTIRCSLGNSNTIASSLLNIGRIQHKRGLISSSKHYYNKALNISKELNHFRWISYIFNELEKIALSQLDYMNAYIYLKQHYSIRDSLFTKESANKISELQIKYKMDQKQQEIELLNQKLQIKKIQNMKDRYIRIFLIFLLLAFLITGAIIYFHYKEKHNANTILRKQIEVRKNVEIALRNSQSELENRVNERTKELNEMNKILKEEIKHKERISKQLIINERLAGVGEISSGIAHEIRNPIAIIKTTAQYLSMKYKESSNELSELTDIFVNSAEKINDTVSCMLEFAKPKEKEYRKGSLLRVLDKISMIVKRKLLDHRISLKKNFPENIPDVLFDEAQIESLMLNLFMNAFEAIIDGGCIHLNVAATEDNIFIRIADNGSGIKPSIIEKIFDPFFTTKSTGTGLGLSSVHEIMQSHSGQIKVFSRYQIGTVFTLIFPSLNQEKPNEENTYS